MSQGDWVDFLELMTQAKTQSCSQADRLDLVSEAVTDGKARWVGDNIVASTELSKGGAPLKYQILLVGEPSEITIPFLNGPVPGATFEMLTKILIDRLEHMQAGPYPCEENQAALQHFRRALDAFNARTARVAAAMGEQPIVMNADALERCRLANQPARRSYDEAPIVTD